MQSIENAIRNALTKADSADPAMRQRIYESVWSAHERAMAANTQLSEPQRTDRRERLKTAISQVEQEMRENDNKRPSDEELQMPATPYDGGLGMPELDRSDMRHPSKGALGRNGHDTTTGNEPDLGYETTLSQPAKKKKRTKSRWPALILFVTFVAMAGLIGWSGYNSFVTMGPVRNDALSGPGNIGPVREGLEADAKDWITIFTPSQPDRISVQGRATTEIAGSANARYARIKSPTVNDTISFDVGSGILAQLSGKQATFEVLLRSDNGGTTQMSVSCEFGALGDCGRKRYDVTDQPSSLLFDVAAKTAQSNASGRLIFVSDISGQGKSVDIYAIRVKVTQ